MAMGVAAAAMTQTVASIVDNVFMCRNLLRSVTRSNGAEERSRVLRDPANETPSGQRSARVVVAQFEHWPPTEQRARCPSRLAHTGSGASRFMIDHTIAAAESSIAPATANDHLTLIALASTPLASAPKIMLPLVNTRADTLPRPRKWFGVKRCCRPRATGIHTPLGTPFKT